MNFEKEVSLTFLADLLENTFIFFILLHINHTLKLGTGVIFGYMKINLIYTRFIELVTVIVVFKQQVYPNFSFEITFEIINNFTCCKILMNKILRSNSAAFNQLARLNNTPNL